PCFAKVYKNTPGRTRTCDLRIRNPLPENSKSCKIKDLQNTQTSAYKPAYKKIQKTVDCQPLDLPADLTEIVTVWPELPEHIKAAIKALVHIHFQGDSQ
ncbi:MAG: hypothetical protein ACFFCW_33080, partial [Candidatus Hodarchaeota archaeon]